MKRAFEVVALLVLVAGSSPLFAAETYGPVLKVKPQGYAAEADESRPTPGTPGNVKNDQGSQPAGMLVPAVQKGRDAAARSGTANEQAPGIGGGMNRDIIRKIPGKPKPTK